MILGVGALQSAQEIVAAEDSPVGQMEEVKQLNLEGTKVGDVVELTRLVVLAPSNNCSNMVIDRN